jgi:NTP pyrophosphatase (non-canonical NTP hydrolase)
MLFENRSVTELVKEAYETAVSKGWHKEKREFGTSIALIHSEITESFEAQSKGHLSEELADVIIRIFNLCGENGFDLEPVLDDLEKKTLEDDLSKFTEREFLIIHSKVSRVLETYRVNDEHDEHKKENVILGLAIVVLYILRLCDGSELPIRKSVLDKMSVNKNRSYRHGGKII